MRRCDDAPRCCPIVKWAKRGFKAILVLTVIAVPVGYFVIPRIARSDWARAKVENEASKALGARVHVGRMDFTWKQGLTAREVRTDIMRIGDMDGAWTAKEVQIKIQLHHLLSRSPRGTAVIRDPHVHLQWRQEVCHAPSGAPAPRRPNSSRYRSLRLYSFVIERGTVVVDHPSFIEPVRIEEIYASGELDARKRHLDLEVTKLTAKLNGGAITARGRLEIRSDAATGRISLSADSVDVNDFVVESIRNLQPMIEVEDGGQHKGGLQVRLDAQAKAPTVAGLFSSLTGAGEMKIFSAAIERSRILHVVGDAAGIPHLVVTRFHTISQKFKLDAGRVSIESAEAQASDVTILMRGTIERTGAMDIVVTLAPRPGQAPVDPVRVVGTVRKPEAVR